MNLQFLESMRMFMGAFEILFGLALVFVGARFLIFALQFLAFFLLFGVVLGLGNVFFPLTGASKVPLIATLVVGLIAGAVGGWFFKGLIKNWGVMLLAGVGGLMVGLMIVTPFKMAAWLKYLIIAVIAGVAAFFGKNYDKQLKVLGTAVIGSALVMHGLGSYLGGFPSFSEGNSGFKKLGADWGYIGYIAGWVVLAVLGAFIQQKYPGDPPKDDVFA
jgi:hypothetical protein